ncbi:hypothetical protein CG433_21810 [Pantoea ananatis]|nr:hypothetical protein CG432_21640 [Pantoea ananatis]PQK87815.1 hypothetical protein CG433_21810 [Pantoea ananatis]
MQPYIIVEFNSLEINSAQSITFWLKAPDLIHVAISHIHHRLNVNRKKLKWVHERLACLQSEGIPI